MLDRTDCFAYRSKKYCSITTRTDCKKCSFYKAKTETQKSKDKIFFKEAKDNGK